MVCVVYIVLPGSVEMLTVSEIQSSDVLVTWSSPSFDGGSPITHYIIQQRLISLFGTSLPQGDANWRDAGNSNNSLMGRVASLNPYTVYQFRVIPVNIAGSGAPSLPSMITVTLEAGRCVTFCVPLCNCHPLC